MYSCFLAFDPDTSHVHHPNPNHVETIVSDFEVLIVWIGQCSLPGILLCNEQIENCYFS